jgi:N-acetyl-gamma-glutamyl-phosphate reductase
MTIASGTTATATVPVFVFGAKGLLAGEFLRLLEMHPGLRLEAAASRTEQALDLAHPHTSTHARTCSSEHARGALRDELAAGGRVAAVLALPHGESSTAWRELKTELGALANELYLVDLAADFRLRDPALYASAYGHAHPTPNELVDFAYGLPEHNRAAIQDSKRVAAAGCFATALQLAVLPAARAGLLDATRPWILNGITGSSGSGAEPKPGTHHPWRHGNLWAYSLEGHRHEAELAQALARIDIAAPIHFLPHSGPFARGIHLTACLPLARKTTASAAHSIYARAYDGEPFVEVLSSISGSRVPDLRSVSGSNRASLATSVRGDVLNVLLTLDNMVKGGAGQALQCLNLMLGFPETWGLPRAGLGVC